MTESYIKWWSRVVEGRCINVSLFWIRCSIWSLNWKTCLWIGKSLQVRGEVQHIDSKSRKSEQLGQQGEVMTILRMKCCCMSSNHWSGHPRVFSRRYRWTCWMSSIITMLFFLMSNNVTSERRITLLMTLIRWWTWLRVPVITSCKSRRNVTWDVSSGHPDGTETATNETLLEMYDFALENKKMKERRHLWSTLSKYSRSCNL